MEFVVLLEIGKVIYVASSERKGIRSQWRNSVCAKSSAKLLSKGVHISIHYRHIALIILLYKTI